MDVSSKDLAHVSLTPAQPYSLKEWEQKRALITQLYRDEEKSLEHVRSVLAQQSFRPTAAMLKKRIRKWDLDRNHKQADMLFAAKIGFERERQSKKTAFVIRNRVVTFEEVQHYFRRKGVRDLKAALKAAAAATPTTNIECHTPRPSSPFNREYHNIGGAETANEEAQKDLATFGIAVILDPNQLPRLLQQPPDLSDLDQLLHLGRDYYDSVFERREWKAQQSSFELGTLELFYHDLSDGSALLNAGSVIDAFGYLNNAFDLIKGILDEETLLFLPYLYHLLLSDQGIQHQEVLRKMLKFTSDMIEATFRQPHPIQRSLLLLRKMPVNQRKYQSLEAFRSLVEKLKGAFQDAKPDRSQLQEAATLLCSPAQIPATCQMQGLNGFQKTSLAVWKLSEDAKHLEFPLSEVVHYSAHFEFDRSADIFTSADLLKKNSTALDTAHSPDNDIPWTSRVPEYVEGDFSLFHELGTGNESSMRQEGTSTRSFPGFHTSQQTWRRSYERQVANHFSRGMALHTVVDEEP